MRLETAAAYLDATPAFLGRWVDVKMMPPPIDVLGEARWDREAIDRAVDALPASEVIESVESAPVERSVFTPATLAQRWNVSVDTIYAAIRSGQLEAFKLGGKLYRIRRDKADAYAARRHIASGL